MKKCVAMVLAVLMLLSLCACASEPTAKAKGTNEELDGILADVAMIPVATMGVSMTITARAVEVLDWCEATSMSGEELADYVKAYYDTLPAEEQPMFEEQVYLVVGNADLLSLNDSREGVLEAAGFDKKLNWSNEAFALAACLDDKLF